MKTYDIPADEKSTRNCTHCNTEQDVNVRRTPLNMAEVVSNDTSKEG